MDDLNLILPIYNEKDVIEGVLQEWKEELDKYNTAYKFILCEDGSTDGTKELLQKIKTNYNSILNQKSERRGYGGAVIAGIRRAKSKYVLCIDSDGQCDPKDFEMFWENRDKADVIIGWRKIRSDGIHRKVSSLMFKIVFKFLFPTKVHDPSAPFVLFKRGVLFKYLNYLTYLKEGFWWGFVGTCVMKNISICEIEINHRARLNGGTQVYHLRKIPSIAMRNIWGLLHLRFYGLLFKSDNKPPR